jgi:hypothetical protein
MSSGEPGDADNTKRKQRQRGIGIVQGLFVVLLGVMPLLNALDNPRVQALHVPDVLKLIASGWCFGLGVGMLFPKLVARGE